MPSWIDRRHDDPNSRPGPVTLAEHAMDPEFLRLPFPDKLYRVVSDPALDHLIHWEGSNGCVTE